MSELWFNAFIEFSASVVGAVVGILGGFGINRWWEGRKFEKRLGEILPTIFFEIKDNKKLLEELISSPSRFLSSLKRFDTLYWDISREDISKIKSTLLIHLKKNYHNLKHLNYLLDINPGSYPSTDYPTQESILRTAHITKPYIDSTLKHLKELLNDKYRQGYERIAQEHQKRLSVIS